jgi:hypothetical protein
MRLTTFSTFLLVFTLGAFAQESEKLVRARKILGSHAIKNLNDSVDCLDRMLDGAEDESGTKELRIRYAILKVDKEYLNLKRLQVEAKLLVLEIKKEKKCTKEDRFYKMLHVGQLENFSKISTKFAIEEIKIANDYIVRKGKGKDKRIGASAKSWAFLLGGLFSVEKYWQNSRFRLRRNSIFCMIFLAEKSLDFPFYMTILSRCLK